MKKYAVIVFILSAFLLLAGLHLNGTLLPESDVGIIGGADRPTVNWYRQKMLSQPHGLLILFGAVGTLVSFLMLIFSRTVNNHCVFSTTATALGLSASASLGAYSLLIFASCFFLTTPSKHPIRFPTSACTGTLALIGFILLMALYFRLRGKTPSRPGVFCDMTFSLLCMPAFFWSYHIIDHLLSGIL
jgi:hypothetical protein